MMDNEQIIREAYQAVWIDRDITSIDNFYSEDFRSDSVPSNESGLGPESVKQLAERLFAGFPDWKEEIEQVVCQGDKVVVLGRITGTHLGELFGIPPTGKPVDYRDISIFTLRDGKIVQHSGVTDNLNALTQLGVIKLPG